MNVIVLHGSMRKNGNTGLLSDEFLRDAADRGHTVEKMELKDKRINDCLGNWQSPGPAGFILDLSFLSPKIVELSQKDICPPVK